MVPRIVPQGFNPEDGGFCVIIEIDVNFRRLEINGAPPVGVPSPEEVGSIEVKGIGGVWPRRVRAIASKIVVLAVAFSPRSINALAPRDRSFELGANSSSSSSIALKFLIATRAIREWRCLCGQLELVSAPA